MRRAMLNRRATFAIIAKANDSELTPMSLMSQSACSREQNAHVLPPGVGHKWCVLFHSAWRYRYPPWLRYCTNIESTGHGSKCAGDERKGNGSKPPQAVRLMLATASNLARLVEIHLGFKNALSSSLSSSRSFFSFSTEFAVSVIGASKPGSFMA